MTNDLFFSFSFHFHSFPLHSERGEHLRRHSFNGGMGDAADSLRLSCPTPGATQRGHHTPWTPLSKDNLKFRPDGYYNQEEPLNYCKSSVGPHKGLSPGVGGGWPPRQNSGPVRAGQGVSYIPSNRMNKTGQYGKPYRLSPSCHSGRGGEVFVSKLYGNVQIPTDPDAYCVDLVKSENGYGECFDGHLMPEMPPIKIEHDSDSENGCDAYGRPWTCRDQVPVDRRYGNGLYDHTVGLQLKSEADYYDPQYSPCQRGKAGISPPYNNGNYQNYAVNNGNANARLLKCNKDLGSNNDSSQFSPQRFPHSDSLCSSQSVNLMDSHVYSQDPHKAYMQSDYNKHGTYEFKGHSLIHSIKREPIDSPPWPERGHDMNQSIMVGSRNVMPCVMSTGHHKSSPYIYMPWKWHVNTSADTYPLHKHTHIHILYTQRNQCALKYFVLSFSYTSIIREELFFKGFPGCHILLLFDEEAQVLVLWQSKLIRIQFMHRFVCL